MRKQVIAALVAINRLLIAPRPHFLCWGENPAATLRVSWCEYRLVNLFELKYSCG